MVDVVCPPQLLQAEGVFPLRQPWGWGGYDLPVPGRKGAWPGIVP